MSKPIYFMLFACGLFSCSAPQATLYSQQVTVAKGNIAFTLPDSSLIYSKPILWPADYSLGSYGEAGAFYHNADSSIRISVYVKAYPDSLQRTVPWRIIADELAKSNGLATIENYVTDSTTHTIEIDYHLAKRQEEGWRGQASYTKSVVIHGPQRTVQFWFSGPDSPASRQQFAVIRTSVRINPTYLQAAVRRYPQREYRD